MRKNFQNLLEHWLLFIASVGWLVNLPQIIKIISTQNATGVSLLTWLLYGVFDMSWLLYGIVQKDRALILSYSLFLLTTLLVLVLTIAYS